MLVELACFAGLEATAGVWLYTTMLVDAGGDLRDLPAPEGVARSNPGTRDVLPARAELGISRVSIYRLEARGLLRSNPALRHKLYSRAEVERFLALDRAKW